MKRITIFALSISLTFAPTVFAQEATTPTSPAPVVTSTPASSSKPEISVGRYVTGGVIGSVVGLGIGHGIQGRYADMGWIFTVTEAVALTVMAAGVARCVNDDNNNNNVVDDKCSNAAKNEVVLGYLGFLGFHVWEIVDVWTGARPTQNSASLFILPAVESTKVGLVYKF
jgi:uncharacterized protein YcfJ